nr:hypothetical protein [Tanacetum cinerariifolium]
MCVPTALQSPSDHRDSMPPSSSRWTVQHRDSMPPSSSRWTVQVCGPCYRILIFQIFVEEEVGLDCDLTMWTTQW